MDVNLRKDQYFVKDEKWYELDIAYKSFLQDTEGKDIVYMELGVGFNTPGIIRYPYERMTYHNEKATLVRLNKNHPEGFKETEAQTVAFTEKGVKTYESSCFGKSMYSKRVNSTGSTYPFCKAGMGTDKNKSLWHQSIRDFY